MPRGLLIWLTSCAVVLFAGCGSLRQACVDPAHWFALHSAGYAGRFRLEHGRWPTLDELEELVCMPNRAARFGVAPAMGCDELVRLPFRTELTPHGADLRMRFVASDQVLCNLKVLAPPAGADARSFPRVVIKTNVFACSSDGWGNHVNL